MFETINGKSGYRIWLGIWICAIIVRIIFPMADPPTDLSWSGGYYADEGFWTHDARNLTIFGEYGTDEWHDRAVSPLVHPIILLLFKFLGPGLLAVRIWASLFSVIALFLLMQMLRNESWGLRAFLFISFSAAFVAYQRIALLETAAILGGCIVLWCFIHARRKQSRSGFILFGASVAGMYLLKSTQLYMFPAALTAIYLSPGELKRRARSTLYWVMGIMAVLGPYFIFIYFPHRLSLMQYSSYYAAQHGNTLIDLAKNLLVQPVLIYMNRFPFMFPAAWAALLLYPRIRKFQETRPILELSYSWLIWGLVMFSPLGYRPFRYYTPLLVPIIIMGSWLWDYLGNVKNSEIPSNSGSVSKTAITLTWISIPLFINAIVLGEGIILGGRYLGYSSMPGFSSTGALALVIVSVMLLYVLIGKQGGKKWIGVACVCVFTLQGIWLTDWHINRRYSVYDTSCSLNDLLPENAVVAGQWAPELCLETPFKAIPLWKGFVNDENPFDTYGITHILSWEYPWGNELTLQHEWFPETMGKVKHVKTFNIKESSVSLWEVAAVPKTPGTHSQIAAESTQ